MSLYTATTICTKTNIEYIACGSNPDEAFKNLKRLTIQTGNFIADIDSVEIKRCQPPRHL